MKFCFVVIHLEEHMQQFVQYFSTLIYIMTCVQFQHPLPLLHLLSHLPLLLVPPLPLPLPLLLPLPLPLPLRLRLPPPLLPLPLPLFLPLPLALPLLLFLPLPLPLKWNLLFFPLYSKILLDPTKFAFSQKMDKNILKWQGGGLFFTSVSLF